MIVVGFSGHGGEGNRVEMFGRFGVKERNAESQMLWIL